MPANSTPLWLSKLIDAARQDLKKAGILGVLAIVLVVMLWRALAGGGPADVVAAPQMLAEVTTTTAAVETTRHGADPLAEQFAKWTSEPIEPLQRNLFVLNPAVFPVEKSKSPSEGGDPEQGFWTDIAKSVATQADQKVERQKLIEDLQRQAANLRLQTIMMGSTPQALIDGDMVKEGDVVASFRILKIEARRIIVEREGIKLELHMK
jgi:hypothetical protein